MDACEIVNLGISRDNWRVLAVVLMSAILIGFVAFVSWNVGAGRVMASIRASGYDLVEISTGTNSYYVVEKACLK